MAPFQYQSFQSPYANTIAQLLLHQNDPQAQAAQTIAAAQARAGEQSAQAWGGAAIGMANAFKGTVDTIQREQEVAPKLAADKIALQNLQEKQRGERDLNTALTGDTLAPGAEGPRMPTFMSADGRYDIPALTQWLNSQGHGAHTPDLVAHAELQNENLDKAQLAQETAGIKRAVYVGGIAQTALKLNQTIGVPYEAGVKFAAQQGIQTKQFTQQQLDGVLGQLGQLPPEQQTAYLHSYVEAADKAQKPIEVKKDSDLVGATSGTVLYQGKPKIDMDWLKNDAATVGLPNETPTAKQSLIAVGLGHPPQARTENQDKERFRMIGANTDLGKPVSPEDLAWAKNYAKEKLLSPAYSADASLARLFDTFAHSDAQLVERDKLQEQKKGRSVLSDKVNPEYYTRISAADMIDRTIKEAQGVKGQAPNMSAAQLQNLEFTMAMIRAQGLNRINTAELETNAGAGSLLSNIESWIGKKAAGQPIPPSIQQGMLRMSQMLREEAQTIYQHKFNDTKTLYFLGDDVQPIFKPKQYNAATGKVE